MPSAVLQPDSFQLDSAQVAMWQQDSRYDYDRELMSGQENLLQWLMSQFWRWVEDTFDVIVDNTLMTWVLTVMGLLLVLLVGWLIWRRRPGLFMGREHADTLDYELEGDTIYGVDFEKLLADAERHGDYRQVVRLLYLQTLKQLADRGMVDWQPSKTPMQYIGEVKDSRFTELSRRFMQVRYGNFEATAALCEQMKMLQNGVIQTLLTRQEGGDGV